MAERYTFVLVHGAGAYGALFDAVRWYLEGWRHEVHTPTMAGHGPDGDPNATLGDAIDSIESYIVDNGLSDIVLYGLSLGGIVVSQVTGRIPDRLRRVVFHNAHVVADGNSIADEQGATYPPGTVLPDFETMRNIVFNDTTRVSAQMHYNTMIPEPTVMFTTKVDQKAFYALVDAGSPPMSYLSFDNDIVEPPGDATSWYPKYANRLGSKRRIVRVPGGNAASLGVVVRCMWCVGY